MFKLFFYSAVSVGERAASGYTVYGVVVVIRRTAAYLSSARETLGRMQVPVFRTTVRTGNCVVVFLMHMMGAQASLKAIADAKSEAREHALWHAAQHGHVVDWTDGTGGMSLSCRNEALRAALWNEHLPVVAQFIDFSGALLDTVRLEMGFTPLTYAATVGSACAVQLLLSAGVCVNQRDGNGVTALICAADKGHAGTVQVLLCARARVDEVSQLFWQTPFTMAATRSTALMMAAKRNELLPVVQLLIAAKADVDLVDDVTGRTALGQAACHGLDCTVEALLAAKADVDRASWLQERPLYWAAVGYSGGLPVVSRLIRAKASVNFAVNGCTLLHKAVNSNRLGVVRALLAAKADTNWKDWFNRTPRHLAAERKLAGMLRLLQACA